MSDPRAIALGAALLAALAPAAVAQDQAKTQQGQAQQGQAQQGAVPADSPLKDLDSQASYGFGLNIGRQLKAQCEQLQVDPQFVARGILDGLNDQAQPLLTDEQLQQVMEQFEQQLLQRQLEANEQLADQNQEQAAKNQAEGEAFRAENAKKPEVKSTAEGLQYEVLEAGAGDSPTLSDTVTINYTGKLIDGTVFDSTEGKSPMTYAVNGFIEGWQQALQLMKVGGTWRVVVPPELAYGEAGTPGGPIPPNATLVFEIELLDIADRQ